MCKTSDVPSQLAVLNDPDMGVYPEIEEPSYNKRVHNDNCFRVRTLFHIRKAAVGRFFIPLGLSSGLAKYPLALPRHCFLAIPGH